MSDLVTKEVCITLHYITLHYITLHYITLDIQSSIYHMITTPTLLTLNS